MDGSRENVTFAYDRLNALLEAAIRDQQAIAAASAALNSLRAAMEQQRTTQPQAIVSAVKNDLQAVINSASEQLTQKIDAANVSAVVAEQALSAATRRATFTVLLPAVGTGLGILLACLATSNWVLSDLRVEKRRLEESIATLERQGARLDMTGCEVNNVIKPCVRVDSKTDYQGYRIIIPRK